MIVTCPKCQTKFRLREGAIGPQATVVRCSRCGSVFRAALASGRGLRRPGPPPGVSDEDYILHGGPARTPLAPEAPPEAETPPVSGLPEPATAEAEPGEAKPDLAAAEARPEPEPELDQASPQPEAPSQPEAEPPEPPEVSVGPEPEPAVEAEPFPEPLPEPAPPDSVAPAAPAPEPAAEEAGQEPLEEPWPEPQQAAAEPAGPLPPPGPTPTAQAPSRLGAWQAALRKRSRPVLVALAAAALVMTGLLIYRSGIIGGGSADPKGTRQITFTGISGYFLKNDHDGVIYVVQGLARNGYKDRRGQIRIKAALYDGAGEAVQEQLVYAGNIFSREDLQRTPLKEIAAALAAPVEGSRSVVRPGATAPFMAVFGNLPKSLGEFSLEAASSSRVASS